MQREPVTLSLAALAEIVASKHHHHLVVICQAIPLCYEVGRRKIAAPNYMQMIDYT